MPASPSRASFASLPDRGDLVVYDKTRQPTRAGAYTWHPVELSEEHALRAVAGAELVVTGPNGHQIRLKYERHVEHPDGNWTWIGRVPGAKPGAEAILTFGEKAVFGSIPYGDEEPLRLTMAAGRAWLMETDRAAIARMDNAATRPRKPDFLLPPKNLGTPMASGTTVSSASPTTQSAAATATTTVDVLLGYTSGFATRLGGQSQAVTRLTYLVDVTNQAYVNSQIDAQVRLVRTMQVDYPDATSNQTALYALTGVECTEQPNGSLNCTDVGPAASLQPLHAARDQYGADLVSLVRNFNDPENGGCGIAWLIGGGQSSIDATDADAGMSIVSDSNGGGFPDDGFVCRDETLAHELAHNMGSAHDRDTADGDDNVLQANEYGRYPYSFGYKTGPGGGDFFTIMAYGDKRDAPPYQQRYRVFSNPDITYCGGFACGVANQADNSRSLRQTIPIIAVFRQTSMSVLANPLPRDLDGNSREDFIWYKFDTRELYGWFMNGDVPLFGRSGGYGLIATNPQGVADFSGDGYADVLLANGEQVYMYAGNGAGGYVADYVGAQPTGFTFFAAQDVDGNRKADVIWFNSSNNSLIFWLMDGRILRQSIDAGSVIGGTAPMVAGDFNADGKADILVGSPQHLYMLTGTGSGFSPAYVAPRPIGWDLLTARDVNNDLKTELIWYQPQTLEIYYWLMNGSTPVSGRGGNFVIGGTSPVATGDYNGDGRVDIVLSSGSNLYMLLANASGNFDASYVGPFPIGWNML